MPIYEYRCESCGHELDALQKLSDEPLRECPDCAALSLRRLISAPSFRLKGDGWYETDFKSEKETKRNLVERPPDAKGDKGENKAKEGEKSSKKANLSSDSKSGAKSGSGSDSDSGSSSGSNSKGSGSAVA